MQERDHRMTADGVFVTGATGFIGRHLVLGLLERGFRVFALTRGANTGLEFLARAADTSRTSEPRSPLPPPVQTAKRNVGRASDVFP
jgi:nucleoside-diphosphate-sugar epimerase